MIDPQPGHDADQGTADRVHGPNPYDRSNPTHYGRFSLKAIQQMFIHLYLLMTPLAHSRRRLIDEHLQRSPSNRT
ncbi:hypothetical protein [Planctomycetes bacterium K23_9]|uniref:hypothetical protein n=1 Tax=Stieleria marina TaxID=1930275 RepID=UPI0011A857E3